MVGMCDYKIATRYTALNDYIPIAPTNDEAKKHNENVPGMGEVFNVVNLHLYHYAGNNPMKYVDPDGRADHIYHLDDEGNVTKSIENDWGFWEFLHTDQYYVETSDGIRYRANSEETVTLYGFNKIDLDFLNGKFNEMIDEANKKPTNFSRIWKESVGGDLDFKNQMDKSTLYFDGKVLYNNQEAGNFVWAYFLTSHGYRDLPGILAQGGSLVFEGRLDEPWDVQARHAGQYYYDKLMLIEMINKISR
jgi:YD repeat protein